jgi:hypothetical protein
VGSGYSYVVIHHRVRPKGFEPLTLLTYSAVSEGLGESAKVPL